MSNIVNVSFKVSPEHYTILVAMAQNGHGSLSEFCREVIIEALDLNSKVDDLASFFAPPTRKTESESQV